MKKLLLFCFALICLNVYGQKTYVDNFSSIDISGSINAILVNSPSSAVDVKMKKGDIEDLIINVERGELKIKFKNKMWGNSSKADVTIFYSSELNKIDCSAGSRMSSEEVVKSTKISVNVSSGANCRLSLDTEKAKASVSSGGKITMKGQTDKFEVEASSGGYCSAESLIANFVEAEASSGGKVTATANKSLNAETSSGGTIKYDGNPDVLSLETNMSGTIKKI